jgi:hypothetical protein
LSHEPHALSQSQSHEAIGGTKEEDMKARNTIRRWLVVGLGLTALAAAPAGHAVNRPADDRVDARVVGTPQVAADSSDIVSRYLISHPAAVRPSDDRVDARVVGTPQVVADSSDIVSRYLISHPAAARPSDARGASCVVGTPRAGIATPAPDQGRSFWGAAELAAASTLGALAVALTGFALIRHRRSATAALQG